MQDYTTLAMAADRLTSFHDRPFGGKNGGRFRVSARLLRKLVGRKRLYEDDVRALARLLLERGYVLVDMDSFFVVLSANAFVNYRRVNEDCIK